MEQVLFHDNYVIAVLVLLWGLCFCRNLLESFTACVRVLDKCAEQDLCCIAPCLAVFRHSGCGEVLRQAVVMFCFLQPAVFCVLYVVNKADGRYSSVILHNVELNSSSLSYVRDNSTAPRPPATVSAVNTVELDYVLVVLPFSLMVSATSLLWVHCINIGALGADTTWDADMPDAVYVYEAVYFIEVWTMNVASIAVMASERSVLEVYYAAATLSLVLFYVMAQARASVEYSTAEQFVSILVTVVFAGILLPLWLDMLQAACAAAVGVAVVHGSVVFVLAVFHSLARGQASAGQVLLVRVGCTMLVCVAHISVYAVGRNGSCQ